MGWLSGSGDAFSLEWRRRRSSWGGRWYLSLADIAAGAGFADHGPQHFKRAVGVTPGQLRKSARIAQKTASRVKNPESDPLTIPQERGGLAWSPAGGFACKRGTDS